jgi:hypothetical protein
MVSTLEDAWHYDIEFGDNYIQYRNRVLDYGSIDMFYVKNKRLVINQFKQNEGRPTMMIIFSDKADAMLAFTALKYHMYSRPEEVSCLTRLRRWIGI